MFLQTSRKKFHDDEHSKSFSSSLSLNSIWSFNSEEPIVSNESLVMDEYEASENLNLAKCEEERYCQIKEDSHLQEKEVVYFE